MLFNKHVENKILFPLLPQNIDLFYGKKQGAGEAGVRCNCLIRLYFTTRHTCLTVCDK